MTLTKNKIKSLVNSSKAGHGKETMHQGLNYYEYKHDILNYRLFYVDGEGEVKEELNRSNIKIAHSFFTELVDQKTDYLLSNPVGINTDNDVLEKYLKEYLRMQFQKVLRLAVKHASMKSKSYVYAYYDANDRLRFQFTDPLTVIPVHDDHANLTSLIRHYDRKIQKDNQEITITKVEYWTDKDVTYYTIKNGVIDLDLSQVINPRPHRVIIDPETKEVYGKTMGSLPFFELRNNDTGKTDLEPVKALIDDYDLMACSLSNNLVDFDYPIVAVKGYPGTDLDPLIQNLKTRKTVGTSEKGGIDVKTVDIPVNARKTKLEVDKESIYRFGRGFDSAKFGDGNITNVVIQSRYSLLELKCNEAETYLRELIEWMLTFILKDIEEKHGQTFKLSEIEVEITRKMMVNALDNAEIEKIKASTEQTRIDTLLSVAPRLDNDTVLAQICDELNLDFAVVKAALESQDYIGLGDTDE